MIGDLYKYEIVLANQKSLTNIDEPKFQLHRGEGYLTHITREDKFLLEDRATGRLIKSTYYFEIERLFEPTEGYTGPVVTPH